LELKVYIKTFRLGPSTEVEFSDLDKIHLAEVNGQARIELRPTYHRWAKRDTYPTDDDLAARFPVWAPSAVWGWVAFEAKAEEPEGSSVRYRLSDGVSDYVWNGAAWVAPVAGQWNTEDEINQGIASFPVTQKAIGLVVNLKTTDKWATPVFYEASISISARFDYWDDLILRSLVPRLRSDFRVTFDFAATMTRKSDRFNVKDGNTDFTPQEEWDIVGIDSVFDHDNDPGHRTNILASFDQATGEVTLTGQVEAGTRVFFRPIVQPEIIVALQHPDYIEVGKTPSLIIESFDVKGGKVVAYRDLIDRLNEQGTRLEKPFLAREVAFSCVLLAGRTTESLTLFGRSIESILSGSERCLLSLTALDEKVTMTYDPVAKYAQKANFSHLTVMQFSVTIKNFYVWIEDAKTMPIVKRFNFGSVLDSGIVGPNETKPKELPAGAFPFLTD